MGARMVTEARLSNTEHSIDHASSSYTRIQSMKERRNKPGIDKVKAEIEDSRVHWSEVPPASVEGGELAAENAEVFQSLKKQWPSVGGPKFSWEWHGGGSVVHERPLAPKSFWDWQYDDVVYDLEKPFAEGGQAQLFQAWGIDHDEELVLKVFKDGSYLRDLRGLLPDGMLGDESTRSSGYFSGGRYCNPIYGATLMTSGRFAFIMAKCWGDLRKLIELRMEHNNLPFTNDVAIRCMWQIARGMQDLHTRDLPHRDLKAANVLIQKASPYKDFDPIQDNSFNCKLADFECSVGILGTGFWRAPEILRGLQNRKNRSLTTPDTTPELFTKKSDVYSYAMTCYEILTGCMPLEGYRANDYDAVLHGERPELPSRILPWMKDLLNTCWDMDPSNRPTFEEIVNVLESSAGFQLDPTIVAIL